MTFRSFALAAAMAIAPATAFAGQTSITYDDLDLSTPQGVAQLDKRIDQAAKKVCTSYQVQTGTFRTASLDQKCYRDALAKLKDQLAALTAPKQQG